MVTKEDIAVTTAKKNFKKIVTNCYMNAVVQELTINHDSKN